MVAATHIPSSKARPPGRARRRWVAYAGFGWAISYLPIHIYWALGGLTPAIGITTSSQNMRAANWGASLVILGAGLISLSLAQRWGEILPRPLRHGAAWIGGVFGILHGLAFSVAGTLRLAGVIEYPANTDLTLAQAHAYDWANLLYFEPWFAIMGLLLIGGSLYARRDGASPPVPAWMRRAGWARPVAITTLGLASLAHLVWASGADVLIPARAGDLPPRLVEFGPFNAAVAVLLAVLAGVVAGRRPAGRRYGGTALTLAGLFAVVWGVFTFDPWTFAGYGPALMAIGLLTLLPSGTARAAKEDTL